MGGGQHIADPQIARRVVGPIGCIEGGISLLVRVRSGGTAEAAGQRVLKIGVRQQRCDSLAISVAIGGVEVCIADEDEGVLLQRNTRQPKERLIPTAQTVGILLPVKNRGRCRPCHEGERTVWRVDAQLPMGGAG